MGASLTTISGYLTLHDIEEVQAACGHKWTHRNVIRLYKRFRALDKDAKGYLVSEELLNIPELSTCPLGKRLCRMFDYCNFKMFAKLLVAFSPSATRRDQLEFIFKVFDIDEDGKISRKDLELILKEVAGSSLSSEELDNLLDKSLRGAGFDSDEISFSKFESLFESRAVEICQTLVDNL